MFLSATDIVRRRKLRYGSQANCVVVDVGYPLIDSVYSDRRDLDLTPPSFRYTPPNGPDGRPNLRPYSGADSFLDFIELVVRPFVRSSLFPNLHINREALFGHSYGGLFVLHTLFTRPSCFNTYLAASPSIGWNDRFITEEEARFRSRWGGGALPSLRISYGSLEQFPRRHISESSENYERRLTNCMERRMADKCKEMYDRPLKSHRLRRVELREYDGEDHGTAISPALSGGIVFFLDQGRWTIIRCRSDSFVPSSSKSLYIYRFLSYSMYILLQRRHTDSRGSKVSETRIYSCVHTTFKTLAVEKVIAV